MVSSGPTSSDSVCCASFHCTSQRPDITTKVSFVSWLCISTPLPGRHLTNPRLKPSEILIAPFIDALWPTGEFTPP